MQRILGYSFLVMLVLVVLTPAEVFADGGHHGGHHRGYYGGHHSHVRIGLGFFGGYYYNPFHYWPYYGYYGGYPYYPYYRGYYGGYANATEAPGALDVNVKPKKTTQVWIDGDYVGLAKAFDGHPQYLWLPKGQYQLILFNPGYRTVERSVTVYPGLVIDLDLDMVPGESTPVETLARPRPRAEPDRGAASATGYGASEAVRGKTAEVEVREVPGRPGRLQLEVSPGDASVYLDGRFLGRGEELTELDAGLVIEPGEHLLEVVRPGREPATRTFEAGSGETVELAVSLALERG